MSHLVTIEVEVKNTLAVEKACQRLNLELPRVGTAQVYQTNVTGLMVKLTGWEYPLVIDTETGKVNYDNYGGVWGSQDRLDEFMQAYMAEQTKLDAQAINASYSEETLENGDLLLTVCEPGY